MQGPMGLVEYTLGGAFTAVRQAFELTPEGAVDACVWTIILWTPSPNEGEASWATIRPRPLRKRNL
jgi:hypothetical protein